MKIETFKKLKDNKYKVILNNEEEITLYDDIIVEYNLLVNKELDEKKLKEIVKSNDKKAAYYIALKMLNTKMRTQKEIAKQLKKYDYDEAIINEVNNKLYQEGYLNDERYIKAYINDQINLTDKGPNKIKRELSELGFNGDFSNEYLEQIEQDVWVKKIDKYITKKLKASSNLSATKLKQKIISDLVNKGHSKELIVSLIDNYEFKTSSDLIVKEYNKIKRKLEKKYTGNELNYYIRAKLLNKGFSVDEIESVIKGE